MPSSHDEYTDYSCSTPTERLARDVEKILRSWHLKGSDRHVSFAPSEEPVRPSISHNATHEQKREAFRSRSNTYDWNASGENVTASPTRKLSSKSSLHSSVQLIRTNEIDWSVTFSDGSKQSITLNLDLWDGPSMDDKLPMLPLSLQRVPLLRMPRDLFHDISTLFGIGQHLTLSLKQAENAKIIDDLVWALGASIVRRHDDKLAPWIVTSVLSGMLQTALQVALSNIHCNLPAFGIWGSYCPSPPDKRDSVFRNQAYLLPLWIQQSFRLPTGRRLFASSQHLNRGHMPPILKATMLHNNTRFWISVMPYDARSSSRLTIWGDLLLKHTSCKTVVLCGAQHLYTWKKATTRFPRTPPILGNNSIAEWREARQPMDFEPETIAEYKEQCRLYAISLVERFSGVSDLEPLWGPVDDPIKAVVVSVAWDPPKDDIKGAVLLTMPLKIRSQQDMTARDFAEMEEGVERSILNPVNNPSSFLVSIKYDTETSLVHLGVTQRLLLAALIRTTVLPASTMIHELTDETEMEDFVSEEADALTEAILNQAGVGAITRKLVHAIDWKTLSDEMIEGSEAERVVQNIMDGSLTLGFPSPPDDPPVRHCGVYNTGFEGNLYAPLPKSAPAGRLLSILFVHMSRLRSPASMALVWTSLVHDLQKRFYARQSLPNMTHVPGLDPQQFEMDEKNCFATSGLRVRAENASYVHCSEPQPDDMHCLIGQKLQAFNIGIESIVATDIYNSTKLGRDFDQDEEEEWKMSGGMVDMVPSGQYDSQDYEDGTSMRSESQFEFYDTSSQFGFAPDEPDDPFDAKGKADEPLERQGARCPVFGVTLMRTGDQLYAPYLQRSHPWTDDAILDRRRILLQNSRQSNLIERLEMAHRFIKSTLLSDMRAFKAANPGAVFEDFTNWYGPPGNVLEAFHQSGTEDADDCGNSLDIEKIAESLTAANAAQIKTYTPSFWRSTWEEALPMPAIDQPSLFNIVSTIEIILDHLETIHPASLLNQVMAVNLSVAYFSMLSTSGNAIKMTIIKTSFQILRQKVKAALKVLSRDATHGTSSLTSTSPEHLPRHASLQAIRACEDACNAISDTEALLVRAMSLMHKFPGHLEIVETILRSNNPEAFIPLDNEPCRKALLGVIQQQKQKQQQSSGETVFPPPSRRSYIWRNTDDEAPCQMSVQYGEDDDCIFDDRKEGGGGLVIAITKTTKMQK